MPVTRTGPTPAGGVRSVARFFDARGRESDGLTDDTAEIVIEEFDVFDRLLARTRGSTRPAINDTLMAEPEISDGEVKSTWDVMSLDDDGQYAYVETVQSLMQVLGAPSDPEQAALWLTQQMELPYFAVAPKPLLDDCYEYLREHASPRALAAAKIAASEIQTKSLPGDPDALIDKWEAELLGALELFHNRQMDIVIARLRGPKARKHTKFWRPAPPPHEIKAIGLGPIVDASRWVRDISSDIGVVVARMFSTVQRTPVDDEIVTLRVERIIDSVRARAQYVLDALGQVANKVDDIDLVVDRAAVLKDQGAAWAQRLALTESVGIVNEIRLIDAVAAGFTEKTWRTRQDEKVRLTHAAVDGQRIDIHASFTVGGAQMLFPGDPIGPPHEVINCRCTLLF